MSIEGYYDEALSVPGLLHLIEDHGFDAVIIACFDDTGLDAARCPIRQASHRDRRGGLSFLDDREQVLGRHHFGPLCPRS